MASVSGVSNTTAAYTTQTKEKKDEEILEGELSPEVLELLNDIENQDEKYVPYEEGLGQDAYFKLLMTQIQHQDPTSPMDNEQMIAQMAQFSIVEQSAKTAEGMDKLIEVMTESKETDAAISRSLSAIVDQLEALNSSFGNMSDQQKEQLEAIEREAGLIQELVNTNKAQAAYQ